MCARSEFLELSWVVVVVVEDGGDAVKRRDNCLVWKAPVVSEEDRRNPRSSVALEKVIVDGLMQ